MVKQGDGRIEIASQMVCGMMLVVSAAVADGAAAFEHMWSDARCLAVMSCQTFLGLSPHPGLRKDRRTSR